MTWHSWDLPLLGSYIAKFPQACVLLGLHTVLHRISLAVSSCRSLILTGYSSFKVWLGDYYVDLMSALSIGEFSRLLVNLMVDFSVDSQVSVLADCFPAGMPTFHQHLAGRQHGTCLGRYFRCGILSCWQDLIGQRWLFPSVETSLLRRCLPYHTKCPFLLWQ